MVMPPQDLLTTPVPTWVPWPEDAADDAAVAAGQAVGAEVAHWLAQAERATHAHAGGQLVAHRWVPAQRNGQAPVVLLHGGSGSWTHWVRSISPLTDAGHEVWAIDLPGFGASDGIPGVHDADGLLPTLAEALQTWLPLQAVQLVGFSFGGMTAGMLTAAYPHLVQQLVLVGAPGLGLQTPPRTPLKGWRHLPTPRAQLAHHVFNLAALMLHHPERIDRDTVALHVTHVRRDRLPRRRISSTGILVQSLAQVTCPVTAIYGAHDVLFPGMLDQVAAAMAAAAHDFRGLHPIADAGHWVQYEEPAAFHAVLLPALAAPEGTR